MAAPEITFSIVIPTYRRPVQLARCLRSLARLDYARELFEVVVVDDGSPTAPGELVEQAASELDIRLVVQERSGPAAARNRGASVARGDHLAFTDDDCTPTADWLTAMARRFGPERDDAVGGWTMNALRSDPYATTSQLIVDLVYKYYNKVPDDARFVTSNNLAVSADGFRAVGGFDESFPRAAAEDRDFCARWLASGRRIVYASDAIVLHAHALDLRGFLRQHFNYGRGARRYHRQGASEGRPTLRRDLDFHLSLPRAAATAIRGTRSTPRPRVAALLVAWQLANAAGYAWEWARGD